MFHHHHKCDIYKWKYQARLCRWEKANNFFPKENIFERYRWINSQSKSIVLISGGLFEAKILFSKRKKKLLMDSRSVSWRKFRNSSKVNKSIKWNWNRSLNPNFPMTLRWLEQKLLMEISKRFHVNCKLISRFSRFGETFLAATKKNRMKNISWARAIYADDCRVTSIEMEMEVATTFSQTIIGQKKFLH